MLVPDSSRLASFGLPADDVADARLAASRQLREALDTLYVAPADLDGFPASPEGDELRALVAQHGIALAALALAQHDGGRSRKIEAEAREARAWLDDVKAGPSGKNHRDLSKVLQRRGRESSPVRQVVGIQGPTELKPEFWPGPAGDLLRQGWPWGR